MWTEFPGLGSGRHHTVVSGKVVDFGLGRHHMGTVIDESGPRKVGEQGSERTSRAEGSGGRQE